MRAVPRRSQPPFSGWTNTIHIGVLTSVTGPQAAPPCGGWKGKGDVRDPTLLRGPAPGGATGRGTGDLRFGSPCR